MTNSFDAEAYVEQASRLCDLPIAPDHLPGVVENMSALAQVADLVMSFPLPETIEPAPTFDPLPPTSSDLG
ncbi:MAG: DUF4089 domain-containing protein [Leptolyngbyaceae bacterium]|nr:DUF4089 domain-containing protein [Leptolyngbyaceae bacterium]